MQYIYNHKNKGDSMKYTYLLALVCCISNMNILSAEKKENITEQQWRETYAQEQAVKKAQQKLIRENSIEVMELKEQHAQEIALYEEKIRSLTTEIEQLRTHK
jgi:hypothetical protein